MYFYMHAYIFAMIFVTIFGFIASFFVKESMHVTFSMLAAYFFLLPFLILRIINNKAIPVYKSMGAIDWSPLLFPSLQTEKEYDQNSFSFYR